MEHFKSLLLALNMLWNEPYRANAGFHFMGKVLVLAGDPMERGARFARLGSAVQGILPYAFPLGPSFPKRAFRGGRARNEG